MGFAVLDVGCYKEKEKKNEEIERKKKEQKKVKANSSHKKKKQTKNKLQHLLDPTVITAITIPIPYNVLLLFLRDSSACVSVITVITSRVGGFVITVITVTLAPKHAKTVWYRNYRNYSRVLYVS